MSGAWTPVETCGWTQTSGGPPSKEEVMASFPREATLTSGALLKWEEGRLMAQALGGLTMERGTVTMESMTGGHWKEALMGDLWIETRMEGLFLEVLMEDRGTESLMGGHWREDRLREGEMGNRWTETQTEDHWIEDLMGDRLKEAKIGDL